MICFCGNLMNNPEYLLSLFFGGNWQFEFRSGGSVGSQKPCLVLY